MPGIEDQPPTSEEISRIREKVREYIDENGQDSFEAVDTRRIMTEDDYVTRFFMHNYDEPGDQCDVATAMIIETLKWRKSMDVKSLSTSRLKESIKERGNLYIHNTDKDGKQLLVFAVKNHKRGEEPADDMKNFFLYCLERIDRETGGDKLTLVFDCAGCGLKNMDMDLVRYMINVFKTYYPHNLNYILVFEMPWVLNAAWKVIKGWLPAAAVKKIKFLTKSNLNEYVSEDQALTAWGGTDDWVYAFTEEKSAMNNNDDIPDGGVGDAVARPTTLQFAIDEDHQTKKSVRFGSEPASQDSSFAASPTPNSKLSYKSSILSSFSDAQSPTASFNAGQINRDILSLNPSQEIVFEVNSSTNSLVAKVQISNSSAKTVVFKIKTTSPEKYRVRPSLSYIKAGDNCDVEIHLHPSQLNDSGAQLDPNADISSVLTAEASASLLKDKFLITAISLEADSDEQLGHAKLTELMKASSPEVQYRLKCGISGLNKISSQLLRNSNVGDKMPTSSTLQNANKQLETLAKKVSTLQGSVSELQDSVVSLKKVCTIMVGIMLIMQFVLLYYISANNHSISDDLATTHANPSAAAAAATESLKTSNTEL